MGNVNINAVTSIWQCLQTNQAMAFPKRKRLYTKRITPIDDTLHRLQLKIQDMKCMSYARTIILK